MDNILRNPTGTRDLKLNDVLIREYIFKCASESFIKRGAIKLDTPIFEIFGLVKNLYGEEFNKLVYKLQDGGSQELILRYDLTVPLARYVAMNGLMFLRRYQIGKVYRLDDPQIEKGRYREFYQCDFDIVGDDQATNIFDIEILETLIEILDKMIKDKYIIKINDRQLLFDILIKNGVEDTDLNTVCSTLDKLDKKSWVELKKDLENINIKSDIINNLESFINKINVLNQNKNLESIFEYLDGIDVNYKTIKNIIIILKEMNLINKFEFDLSLSRGLDYYTGLIFEVLYNDKSIMQSTICSGGRYDKIIGKFSNKGEIPSVGLSIGVERIAVILEKTLNMEFKNNIQIYIATIGENMVNERIKLCCELRNKGYICSMSHLNNPKMRTQFDDVFNNNIPFMIILGENEIKKNILTIKDINKKIQHSMNKDELLNFLDKNLIIS